MSDQEKSDEMFTVNVDGGIYLIRWDDSSITDQFSRYIISGNDLVFTIQLRVFPDLAMEWIAVGGDYVEGELVDKIGQAIEEYEL